MARRVCRRRWCLIAKASPHTQTAISAIHPISIASSPIQSILDRLVLIIDEWFPRPISGDIDINSRKDYFQENQDEVVDDGTETEQLPSPDTTPIVSL